MRYARLDGTGDTGKTLRLVKACLTNEIPVVFGFQVPSFITEISSEGRIPDPDYERLVVIGGQAVVACGYRDASSVRGRCGAEGGALLIRNSWGPSWGLDGHAWLPYKYVEQGWAADFWILLSRDWLAEIIPL